MIKRREARGARKEDEDGVKTKPPKGEATVRLEAKRSEGERTKRQEANTASGMREENYKKKGRHLMMACAGLRELE